MLTKVKLKKAAFTGGRFAIVAAKYNPKYVDAMVKSARSVLASADPATVDVFRVPGSFEIPVVAARLAEAQPAYDAILCFGAILRGATSHANHIAEAVSQALAQLQILRGIPIIHGVLLFENEEQARVRCLGREHNRGIEAGQVALEMAQVMRKISDKAGRA